MTGAHFWGLNPCITSANNRWTGIAHYRYPTITWEDVTCPDGSKSGGAACEPFGQWREPWPWPWAAAAAAQPPAAHRGDPQEYPLRLQPVVQVTETDSAHRRTTAHHEEEQAHGAPADFW
jgi:hypothetical protein